MITRHLFNHVKVGHLYHYPKIMVLHGQYCYLSGMKVFKDGAIDYCIVVSFNKPQEALGYYRQRWQIETLFKGIKSSGFNIEDTHVTHQDRLEKLLLLVMIAFVWCYKVGDYIDSNIRKIVVKKHGRRAVSVFKYGMDYLSKCLNTGFDKLNINALSFLSCT